MLLSACQTTQQNSRIIASAFNLTTGLQQKIMDRYAPKNIQVQHDIVYATQPNLSFDLYQNSQLQDLAARPTIVWIHGGGWIAGSKAHARGYFKLLAAQGFNVIAVQYQFAPHATYPTQLQQIDQALNYITQHAEKYQLNPQQLYLAGDSAGANLASHYAELLSNPAFAQQSNLQPTIQHKQLKGLILHCGIYDLKAFVETARDEMNIVEWGVYNLVQAYTGDRKQDSEFLKNISPIQHLTANYPAVFISGGNKDFLTETQSMPMLHALQQQQIPVTTAFYPDTKAWLIHEYQFFMHQKESQQTFAKTVEFIRSTADPNVSRIQ
ncbi:alpha/beta hydrolase [Acinetobacter sp. YH16058]|uniref:alpha/beta hydrolase n=1 Tax=Acinetobacter sp. YH16058 TaxID=2601196 RepID=UPI0015D22CB4|nr:alpha/beta hydrolase [Acinetobacter sp. YH16058]